MNGKEILCRSCCRWVDCGEKDGEPWGYCVIEPLYTHTAYTRCGDYVRGEPIKEDETVGF